MQIFNIYNSGPWDTTRTDTIELFDRVVDPTENYIILEDFNFYYPAWSEQDMYTDPDQTEQTIITTNTDIDNNTSKDRWTCTDRKAPVLLEFTDSRLLDLWLEPGTVIRDWNNYRFTIDLVFGAQSLADQFIVCKAVFKVYTDSDHLLICTILDFFLQVYQPPKRYYWKAMDAAKLRKFVADNLNIYLHWNRLRTDSIPAAIDSAADFLIEIVQCAIQYTVP